MKVIKEGDKESGWFDVVKCTGSGNGGFGCNAELEIREEDLFHTYMSQMGRFEQHFTTIECPCCKTWTDVKILPSNIYSRVIKKEIQVPNK